MPRCLHKNVMELENKINDANFQVYVECHIRHIQENEFIIKIFFQEVQNRLLALLPDITTSVILTL